VSFTYLNYGTGVKEKREGNIKRLRKEDSNQKIKLQLAKGKEWASDLGSRNSSRADRTTKGRGKT